MTELRNEEFESRDRETDSREKEKRETPWKPASLMPTPHPREGFDFRYVRISMRGETDNVNVSQAFRDGWEPVVASQFPELKVVSDHESPFPDSIVVGGLLLCQRPSEVGVRVKEYAEKEVQQQMEAVDRNYFREQDSRMPLLRPERNTRITFGDD